MTPADRALLESLAAQCERMSEQDSPRLAVEDVHALARAIRAALARITNLECER